jgi:beta-galactosidase
MRHSFLHSSRFTAACGLLMTLWIGVSSATSADDSPRTALSLDQGWRFYLGDIPHTDFKANWDEAEGGAKGGGAWGAAAPKFDDSAWRELDLPHDWVVEQSFVREAIRNQGYRPRGIAWYRRRFRLDPSDRGKHLELQFDGVSTHCTVWFNGSPVHHNWNGYTSFYIDVTSMARYGNDLNTVALRVDAKAMEGWWYEGGGIYRHTWLVKRSPVHIVTDGVYADPVKLSDGKWMIPVEVTLENSGYDAAPAWVDVSVIDPSGKEVARKRSAGGDIAPVGKEVVKLSIPVSSPRLWSVDEPNLYTVTTKVESNGKTDAVVMKCGFRTIRFDNDEGFFLNDQPLKLQGVCCHQDHAGVGVAVPDSLLEFRIRKLKEMGANAYRSAHNPPSKELLDICDRMGMLVMDETRHFNSSPEYLDQLEWLVRRDRNHPSVIMWSLFNEENALQGNRQGMEMTRRMNALVKQLDPIRPTTAAQNGGQLSGDKANPENAAHVVDVVGINYQVDKYDKIRAAYPDKPIISTEECSQVMTRGEYATDMSRQIIASYDDIYNGWSVNNRIAWEVIAKQPSFGGGFIWTGFDYHGEPTPFGWPSVSSYFGCLDLCGFPKTAFYIRQALWIHDKPVLTLVPHWNWPGMDGKPVKVMALANCDTVELLLNGKSLGEKPVDKFEMVSWEVPYAPGKLEAFGKTNGRQVSHFTVETTGEPVALRLIPDRKALAGDGNDALPVTIGAIDKDGRPVPTANLPVEFEITGPGAIIGLGNGDPTSHEPEKGNKRSLFNGLAQVIVQSQRGGSGNLVLRAKAEGLKPAETTISVEATPLYIH